MMAVATRCFRQSMKSVFRQGNKIPPYFLTQTRNWILENNYCSSSIDKEERLFSEVNLEIKGNDEAVLDCYSQFIRKAAQFFDINTSQVALPRNIERYTILKSPHIYKKHRVQYEIRTHRLLIQLETLTGTTSDVFLEYIQRNCPEGVSMDVQQTELEQLLINIPPEAKAFLEIQSNDESNPL